MSSDRDRPKITRRRGACVHCQQKKIRCNGGQPCALCRRHGINCTYSSRMSDVSSAARQIGGEPRQRATARKALPTVEHSGRLSSGPSDLDPMDWFMNLATPCSSSFDLTSGDMISPILGEPSAFVQPPTDLTFAELSLPNPHSQELNSLSGPQSPRGWDDDPSTLVPSLDSIDTSLDMIIAPSSGSNYQGHVRERPQHGSRGPRSGLSIRIPIENKIRGSERERKRKLFPALSFPDDNGEEARPCSEPNISPLISTLRKAGIDEGSRQTATKVIMNIMAQQCQRSLPARWWCDRQHESGHEIVWENLPLNSLISRCFEEPLGVILYLDQHEALTAARDFQNTLSTQTPFFVTSIVVTLAAWGSLLATDRHPPDLLELIALTIEAYEALNAEPDSLGKFLAMVAALQLINILGVSCVPKMLATTISMIQCLSLHTEAGLQSLCTDVPETVKRVKRACWTVFCIDKINNLRWKSFPLLPDSCLQYSPPPLHDDQRNQDWLLHQCRYAKICAQIYSGFSPARLENSELSRSVVTIAAELRDWRESLFEDSLPGGMTGSNNLTQRLRICTLYQYCEASLALLDVEQASRKMAGYSGLRPKVISLIRDIFQASNQIEPDHIVFDRTLLFLPSFSLCKIVTQVLTHGTADFEDARAMLAVAHGYFARTSTVLPTHDFFNQVTKLIDVAVKHVGA